MAGKILPIALAAVAGVSIGVATFDGEFKKQRTQRLEEEYTKEIAALASSNTTSSSPAATSAAAPMHAPPPGGPSTSETIPKAAPPSSLSSILGLWAWKGQYNNSASSAADQIGTSSSGEDQKKQP
ncbi:hypothetical protein ACN47E_005860 [Coniothyrium glycines]